MTSPESPCPCVAGEDVPGSSTSWAAAFLDFVDNITGEPESLPRQRGRAWHSPEFVCGSSLTTILYEHPIRRRHHVEHHLQHSKIIFDNIMNREIPWPRVPEELSFEAYDLIDKLLMENPVQRLGATGGGEGR